jgi:hypothetical protein
MPFGNNRVIVGRNWGDDALEVDAARTEPSNTSTVWMPLRVLAHFNRQKAIELLVANGRKRRVAKRQVARMLKTERLRKKRQPQR